MRLNARVSVLSAKRTEYIGEPVEIIDSLF